MRLQITFNKKIYVDMDMFVEQYEMKQVDWEHLNKTGVLVGNVPQRLVNKLKSDVRIVSALV